MEIIEYFDAYRCIILFALDFFLSASLEKSRSNLFFIRSCRTFFSNADNVVDICFVLVALEYFSALSQFYVSAFAAILFLFL